MEKIPNGITLLRIILTIGLNGYIFINFGHIAIPLILTALIFFTDSIDGKVARRLKVATNFGAIFDVFADLVYILMSYLVLCWYHILPWGGAFLILFKFFEFIGTSFILKSANGRKQVLTFDYLGKSLTMIFYMTPIVAYLSYCILESSYMYIMGPIFCVILIMAVLSSIYRFRLCLKSSTS